MMKNKLFPIVLMGLTTVFSISNIASAKSTTKVQYICDTSSSIPKTYVITSTEKIEFIGWESEAFINSGYPPKKRCQEVTQRFQKHSNAGNLRFITTGKMNRQKVICVAHNRKSSCTSGGLLITLESKDEPKEVLTQLFNVSTRKQKMSVTRGTQIYIDVNAYLSNLGNRRKFQPIKKEITQIKPPQNQSAQIEIKNSHDDCNGSFFCQ